MASLFLLYVDQLPSWLAFHSPLQAFQFPDWFAAVPFCSTCLPSAHQTPRWIEKIQFPHLEKEQFHALPIIDKSCFNIDTYIMKHILM